MGWEHVDLPKGESMGLSSFHLDFLKPSSRLGEMYLGLGGYGAVTGDRGGLFVWGPSAGIRRKIIGELALDSGFFVGGGGGAGAPQGGGLMIRPHIGLEHPFGPVNLRLEASHVRFPLGDIASTGIYLGITIPWSYYSARNALAGNEPQLEHWSDSNHRIGPTFMTYMPVNSTTRSGTKLSGPIGLAGLSYQYFMNDNWYLPAEAYGAMSGGVSGYMTVLGGLGYEDLLSPRSRWNIQMLLGAGGGGDVDTGGGILIQPMAGVGWQVSKNWMFKLMGGYTWSMNGQFQAPTVAGMFYWSPRGIDFPSDTGQGKYVLSENVAELDTWKITLSDKIYFPASTARTKSGGVHESTLHLINVGLEKPLSSWLSITGHGASAAAGGAGGYSEGLLGLRAHHHLFQWYGNHELGFNLEAGAAGGGGMDVGSGFIGQATAGWRWGFSDNWTFNASAGIMRPLEGSFKANVLDLGLIYNFGRGRAK